MQEAVEKRLEAERRREGKHFSPGSIMKVSVISLSPSVRYVAYDGLQDRLRLRTI